MFIRHMCYFLIFFLSLVILQIKFFHSFYLFCKFSYLDQFHSFKLAILLHHFLTEFSSVTRKNFLSFFLCIFIERNFLYNFIYLHLV